MKKKVLDKNHCLKWMKTVYYYSIWYMVIANLTESSKKKKKLFYEFPKNIAEN